MTDWGGQMLERRCLDAGMPPVHPHQFRHAFAYDWLATGGQERDLMRPGRLAPAGDGRARRVCCGWTGS